MILLKLTSNVSSRFSPSNYNFQNLSMTFQLEYSTELQIDHYAFRVKDGRKN
jgi:hypothetical protein